MQHAAGAPAVKVFSEGAIMTTTTLLVVAVLAAVAGVLLFRVIPMIQTYLIYRGTRLVTCPETLKSIGKTKIDFEESTVRRGPLQAVTQRNQNRGESKTGEKRLLGGIRASEKRICTNAYLATGFVRRAQCMD